MSFELPSEEITSPLLPPKPDPSSDLSHHHHHHSQHQHHCTLLGGQFAAFIQASLAILCIATLIVKRQYENPRRELFIWFLDVMKQGIGSSFGHFSNIYLSILISNSLPEYSDQCQWYGLTYIIDCSFGTLWNLLCLQCLELCILRNPFLFRLFNFGDYGNPPQFTIFIIQLLVWLVFVITGKLLIIAFMYHFLLPINTLMSYLFWPLKEFPELELVLVMVLIPTVLNIFQFWITDAFIKRQVEEEVVVVEGEELIMDGIEVGDSEGGKLAMLEGKLQTLKMEEEEQEEEEEVAGSYDEEELLRKVISIVVFLSDLILFRIAFILLINYEGKKEEKEYYRLLLCQYQPAIIPFTIKPIGMPLVSLII